MKKLARVTGFLLMLALAACGPAGPRDAPEGGEAKPFALMNAEGFGPLRIGLAGEEVTTAIGPPDAMTAPELWAADGLYHREWRYPGRGLILDMASPETDGRFEIASVLASAPCALRTSRGIGIGDAESAARTAYQDALDTEAPAAEDQLIAGSVYGGLVLSFEEGKVSRMFLGASAE